MENLIRIKFDPRRGQLDPIDFVRPCFRLSAWPNASVDIWYSDDDGESWEKVPESDYRSGYDAENLDLYVSLLFNITDITLIAFFSPEGSHVGIGYTISQSCQVGIGCQVEGQDLNRAPVGWSTGYGEAPVVPCGCSIYGALPKNIAVGYVIKWPTVRNAPLGASFANPADSPIGAGFDIGIVTSRSSGVGATILGLGEYPAEFLPLDPATIAAMSAQAAHRKQKTVTLNGTTPEELD